ncbi:MAG: hypothetical protein IPF70_12920 [Saprospiraceae bacterium]|nr:hypothetical protein [Saprospiraceae bacterium]
MQSPTVRRAALSLTNTYGSDSIRISRTSLKYRNPANGGYRRSRSPDFFRRPDQSRDKNGPLKPIIIGD